MSPPLNGLLFGGCLINRPISVAWRNRRRGRRLAVRGYGPINEVHTFGEMFQIIEILRGRKVIPPEYHDLSRTSPDLLAVPGAEDFVDVDVALVEPASPIELVFRDIVVNRTCLTAGLLAPLGLQGREATKLCREWFRLGLMGLNETVREEAGAKLIEHVQGDTAEAELTRDVIRETRAYKSDIQGGFRKMQDLLGCPIGSVAYVFRYMPDGRAISWPVGFREEVLAAAQEMNLPIFDPAPLVVDFGIDAALTAELGHYSDDFLPVIGEALVEFAETVYEGSRSRPAVTA